MFNAAVARDAMPAGFVFDAETPAWVRADGTAIAAGSDVVFNVVSVEAHAGGMAVVGSLLPEDLTTTGPDAAAAAAAAPAPTAETPKEKKKKRARSPDAAARPAPPAAAAVAEGEGKKEKKKKKDKKAAA